jgi:hypothetical protein
MTLDEAQQLAHLVEQSEDWIVTAIGRFVLLDELQAAVAGGFDQKLPWMVAIMAVGDVKTLTKLTCLQDWYELTRQIIPQPHHEVSEPTQIIPNGMLF